MVVDTYHAESGAAPGINVSGLKNPLTEFFGPPAKIEFGAQDRLSHETWNLSEWADLPGQTMGKSPFMAVTIESLVVDFDEWPTRVLMPWVHTDSINVQWSVWRFDQTLADYEPEQAPPRFITSHTEHHTSRLVRRGLAFILEHGFWSTPGGRMAYVENLRVLQSACHETVQQATINALLAEGKAWERAWNERYGKPARTMRDVLEQVNWSSFIVNKREHGWEVMDAYLCKFLSNERVEPTTWVVPPKMKLFASIVPSSEVEYYRRGARAEANLEFDEAMFSTFRGKAVYETRDIATDVDADPINALRRIKEIGDWHLAGNHWAVSCTSTDRCRAYSSDDMSVDIFNMDNDDFGRIDANTMLKYCNRFDASGNLSEVHKQIANGRLDDLDMGSTHDMFLTPTGTGGGEHRPIEFIGEMSMDHWSFNQRREAAACYAAALGMGDLSATAQKGYEALLIARNPSTADYANVKVDIKEDRHTWAGKTISAILKKVKAYGGDDVKAFMNEVRSRIPFALPSWFADFLSVKEQTGAMDYDNSFVAFVTHALFKWYPSLYTNTGTVTRSNAMIAAVRGWWNVSSTGVTASHIQCIEEAAFGSTTKKIDGAVAADYHGAVLHNLYTMAKAKKTFAGCHDAEIRRIVGDWRSQSVDGTASEMTESDISVSREFLQVVGGDFTTFAAPVPGMPARRYDLGDFAHAGSAMEDKHMFQSFASAAQWNSGDAGSGPEDMEFDFTPAGARTREGFDYDPRGSIKGLAPSCADVEHSGLHTALQYVASEKDINKKIMFAGLQLAPATHHTFEMLLQFNVPLPCKFLIVRPFRNYEAGAGILARGGIGLGANLYGRVNFQFGDNILAKTHVGHLTFYHRSVVRGPKQYVVADAMFCLGYIRGENLMIYETPDQFDPHNSRSHDGRDRSVFVFMVPATMRRDSLPNPLDLTGRWHGAMANGWFKSQATANNDAHHSSAAYYNAVWKFDHLRRQYESVRDDGYFEEPHRIHNTVCFEGMGWHSCPTSSKRRFTISSDALGPNVYRGVRAARSGCGEQFKEQNYHKHYVPF